MFRPTSILSSIVLIAGATILLQASGADAVVVCGSDTDGTTYNVGPSQTYTKIGDVPLDTLQPGSATQPIVISGVPDETTGDLPIINGENA
eukprot:3132130-Ditylum_brightwellii.AAC.1